MSNIFKRIFLCLIAGGLIVPFIIVFGVSVNPERSISFPPNGVTLKWYQSLFSDPQWLEPMYNSATIAVVAAMIATSVALSANFYLWRTRSCFARAIVAVGVAPYLLPPIILALGASIFWAYTGLYGNILATMISHGIFFAPLPMVVIARGFAVLSDELIEASKTLGATSLQSFVTVIMPLVLPFVITGFALVAIISFNEYLISNMISGFIVETLPVKIFNNIRNGYSPMLASAAMGFVMITSGVLLLVSRFTDLLELFGGRR